MRVFAAALLTALLAFAGTAHALSSSEKIELIQSGGQAKISYPLDNISGNVVAAYSLRRLSGAYTGSAVKIRRSSDNAQKDIGFSGADLDVNAASSFCNATTCFVSEWYDQSNNNNGAVQATAAQQPQLQFGVINGKPAVLYTHGGSMELSPSNTGFSIFGTGGYATLVTDITSVPTTSPSAWIFGRGNDQPSFLISAPSGKLEFREQGTINSGTWDATTVMTTGRHIIDLLYSEASLSNAPTMITDGTTLSITGSQPTGSIPSEVGQALFLGNNFIASGALSGYLAEQIFFSQQPSSADQTKLRANQKSYWGTP